MLIKQLNVNNVCFSKFSYYLFKIIGLAPLRCDITFHNTKLERTTFVCSWQDRLYNNVSLIFLIIGLNYYSIKASYELTGVGNRNKYERTIDTIYTGYGVFTALYVLCVYCIQQEQIKKIANKISAIKNVLMLISYKVYTETMVLSRNIIAFFFADFIMRCLV